MNVSSSVPSIDNSIGAGNESAGTLVAVVVTYNRLDQLQTTLQSLLAEQDSHLHAVVVVDNASDDETLTWLGSQTDPRLETLALTTNGGGAGGFAAGMSYARQRFDPDWLLLMDDDARPSPGALKAFHEADLSAWDAVAAAVYFPDGRLCEMNRPSRNPFWHIRSFILALATGRNGFHISPARYSAAAPTPIDVTSFVGFFLSRSGMRKAGLPDPGLFLYGDDGLYTLRLRKSGGKMAFLPKIRFEHDCRTFGMAQRGRFEPLWKTYYYHRNLLMLYRMAAGPIFFWLALAVILPKWILKARHHPSSERRVFLRLMFRAIRDGLLHRSNIEHSRVLEIASDATAGG